MAFIHTVHGENACVRLLEGLNCKDDRVVDLLASLELLEIGFLCRNGGWQLYAEIEDLPGFTIQSLGEPYARIFKREGAQTATNLGLACVICYSEKIATNVVKDLQMMW